MIENAKPIVPKKGIPLLLQQFTKLEIAQRFLRYICGKESLDNTELM